MIPMKLPIVILSVWVLFFCLRVQAGERGAESTKTDYREVTLTSQKSIRICDESIDCVQGVAEGELKCETHEDCEFGCPKNKSTWGICGHREEIDRNRPMLTNEMGKDQSIMPLGCLQHSVVSGERCGCLEKTKKCGVMTDSYYVVSRIDGRLNNHCETSSDCGGGCAAKDGSFEMTRWSCLSKDKIKATNGQGKCSEPLFGGLACGCLKKSCSFALPQDLRKAK